MISDEIGDSINGDSTECHERVSEEKENFGDDESKSDLEQSSNQRKTKRNLRVEKGDNKDVAIKTRTSRLHRQSSSEDEVVHKTRTSSLRNNRILSSEDESFSNKQVARSKTSVRETKASFEQLSESESTSDKRSSFSGHRAHSVATPGKMESRRTSFGKTRAASVQAENSPRKSSVGRPGWSSSTKVEHSKVEKNTLSRKESTTQSESDEPNTASQIRSKFEDQESTDHTAIDYANKIKAFGGSTGAAALKAKFESPRGFQQRKSSSSGRTRGMSTDEEDGGHKKLSTSVITARFEAKNTENGETVKRNFVIRKGNAGGAAKKFNVGAPSSSKCLVCNKTVYPLEKLEADNKLYHKFCFKCATCNRTVSLGNYAALEGKIYCKPHLKQLFKLKGNYDEGFGREQRKADWIKKNEAATAASSDPSADADPGLDGTVDNGHITNEAEINGHEEFKD